MVNDTMVLVYCEYCKRYVDGTDGHLISEMDISDDYYDSCIMLCPRNPVHRDMEIW